MTPPIKTKLVPISFERRDRGFDEQVVSITQVYGDHVELLPEVALGSELPPEADAVVFPQLLGDAYKRVAEFQAIDIPILIITSEFGTMSMWDWEIMTFLRENGVRTLAPYNTAQAKIMFRAAQARRSLRAGTFLMYQDSPGDGQQASIFKRFWWWEEECKKHLKQRFGVDLKYKSFATLGRRAADIADEVAQDEWDRWEYPTEGLSEQAICSATKVFLAVKDDVEKDKSIVGVGINCLNESHCSDTTPCIAWNMFFDQKRVLWACEADILSLLTEYLVYKSVQEPIMMTNVYPFLMGNAALKHERIPSFPDFVDNWDNHILVAHCGYFGLTPQSFSESWTLRPKVLEIVNEKSHVMDARWPTGPITMVKLDPYMRKLMVVEGTLKGYADYPGSDCVTGGIIEIDDGHSFMRNLYSHHQILVRGHQRRNMDMVADVFDLHIETI
mgnify:CR=1 FL=1